MTRRHTGSEISYRLVVGLLATVAVIILVSPILVVLITSFTTAPSLKFPPPGFSLKWYEALFDPVRSRHIHVAAGNTLSVGIGATIIVTMLGVAAAAGLAGKRGSWARVLENGASGLLVDPGDVGAMTDALCRLRDPQVRARLAQTARRRFEEAFTLDRMVRTYQDLYGELVNR